MCCGDIVYIVSVFLQVLGAELLIVHFWTTPMKMSVQNEIDKRNFDGGDEDDIIGVDKKEQEECESKRYSRDIWKNRIAFVFIALGYLLGVLGSNKNQCLNFVIVLSLTLVALALIIVARARSRKMKL